ncbi:MAG: copper resistance protein B [Candidatus Binatia bacterium]
MRIRNERRLGRRIAFALSWILCATPSAAQTKESLPSTADRPDHAQSAHRHEQAPQQPPETPPLPEGMSLDDVLERAAQPPPEGFPDLVPDDQWWAFALFEQFEYRLSENGRNQIGWEAQGWIGYDYDRFWWKTEGEGEFNSSDEGETENDLLYSRLITPFWNAQIGAQYADSWESGDYKDRWSGVLALQGLSPGMIEIDSSLYISERADVTLEIEGEYNIRLTQRAVLQPRAELSFAAQAIEERDLGAGMPSGNLDLRLRYEYTRKIAPYVGLRYRFLTGETRHIARRNGDDTESLYFLAGLRLAF